MKRLRQGIALLALAALALAPSAAAQEKLVLTLEDSIRLALERNPFYQAAQAREDQASAQVREAVAGFFPSVSAQGMNVLDKKVFSIEFPSLIPGEPPQRIKFDFTRAYQFTVNFSVPLFTGGRLISGYKSASLNLEATREAIRQTRQETVFNVKAGFYGLLLARETVAATQEAVTLAEDFQKNVKNLYDVGMSSKFDLLRSEVQAANLKPQLIRARNALEEADLRLKTLLGLDLGRPVEFKGELSFRAVEVDADQSVVQALAARPELHQLRYQRQLAGELVKIAQAAHLPAVAVGGAYNYWANQLKFGRNAWENFYQFNLVVNIPIFGGFSTSAKVGESKAALKQIELSEKGLTELVKLEVQEAVLSLRQSREAILSQGRTVEEAQEAVRIAELNYKEGLATNLDVSSAQVALRQARTNYSLALFEYAVALARLEKAVGANTPYGGKSIAD
ncbi:MAG: TolC family protein [Candidatus Aminicenantes bacterium]|nr:TolC family protein [Candidatus Aminicenantes bacterium]